LQNGVSRWKYQQKIATLILNEIKNICCSVLLNTDTDVQRIIHFGNFLSLEIATSAAILQYKFVLSISFITGRAIAEVVSRWVPTAAARVRVRVSQVGFVVDKVAWGQVFSEYFGFPCQKERSFHQLLRHHNHQGQLAETLRRADHPSKEYYRLS
jgi:hypothetical protein